MAAYQVIARKWRPQNFSELVGQNHVAQTLLNALKNQRLHHALLFTGPRGTGKTSSARILAKSVRCPHAVDFVPCDKCIICEEISTSSSSDVRELDAASNNSVDDIRELLSGVMHLPSSGTYKIYIIDEVHMLSLSAFNALLKTLEEPPAHVLFIMATTEAHKIPATILSRCQRYDFRRISTREIAERLKLICQTDGIQFTEEALWTLARQGDGSLRDSESLLDQAVTFSSGQLTQEQITKILGLTDRHLLFETLQAICARDAKSILNVLKKISASGVEPKLFAQEFVECVRHLLFGKISGAQTNELLDLPDSELKFFADLGSQLSQEDVHLIFDMALKGTQDLIRSFDPRLVLEMLLLRMVAAPRILDLKDLIKNPFQTTSAALPVATHVKHVDKSFAASATPIMARTPTHFIQGLNSKPEEKWLKFVDKVRESDGLFAAKIESLLFLGEREKVLRLGIPSRLSFLKDQMKDVELNKKLKAFIDSYWGPGYAFEISAEPVTEGQGESAQSLATKKKLEEEEALRKKVGEHPMVKAAQNVFKGRITSVSPMKGN